MSSKNNIQPKGQVANKVTQEKNAGVITAPGIFRIGNPILLLALAVIILYSPSIFFTFTELDDSIFIKEFQAYNQDLHNLIVSFGRGVFDATKDQYYRPLFLDSMILNYLFSGEGQNIASYHIANILFHLTSVLLLFKLFRLLVVKELHAFLLCLLFAVHPVLTEAVAWIPGRNDTILAIFTLSYLIFCIQWVSTGVAKWLWLSIVFLILAFFTKETAVFIAPTAFILLVVVLKRNWKESRMMVQYGVMAGCFALWYIARSMATLKPVPFDLGQVIQDFIHRLPLVIQYLGKIFLPFNLSVFPILEDTTYVYGAISLVILSALIYLNRNRDWRYTGAGLGIFILFLLPILLIPHSLNEQTFEHRLYLPLIGMMLALSQSALVFNRLTDKQLFTGGIYLAIACGVLNYTHQQHFKDPISFWTQAEETSPHSAYAVMMFAARLNDKADLKKSYDLMRYAYKLNPKEKYLNFYIGQMLQNEDSVMASEPFLLMEKQVSDYILCDFLLARVAMEKKDFVAAIKYLESYLERNKYDDKANNNLMLLYFQTNQRDKAIAQVERMRRNGIVVPPQFLQQLGIK